MPYLLIHPASYFYVPDLSFDIATYNRAVVICWLVPIGVFVCPLLCGQASHRKPGCAAVRQAR